MSTGKIKQLAFSEGVTVGTPSEIAALAVGLVSYASEAAFVSAEGTATAGDAFYDTAANALKYYNGSTWVSITTSTTPTTTRGDLIRRGAAADERFSAVTDNRVVRGDGTDVVSGQIDDPAFFTTGAEVTQSLPGVVKSAGQLLGTNTNDSAGAGYVGEFKSNNRSTDITVSGLASDTAFSIDSGNTSANDGNETGIALTAGDWDISGSAYFETSGSTVTTVRAWIGTATGNSTTGRNLSQNFAAVNATFGATGGTALALPTFRVSLSGNQTYYLKGQIQYSVAGTIVVRGIIRARRVR